MNNHILENSLIVAALLTIILTPVIWAVIHSRRLKRQRISSEIIKAEKDYQAQFHHIDHLDSSVIALDENKKVILQMDVKDYTNQLIDLKNVASCAVEEKKQKNNIQLLQLVLRNSGQQALHHIVLYKQYIDNEGHLKKRVKTAAQWEVLINRAIAVPA